MSQENLTGRRFGRWLVLRQTGHGCWDCRCDCGTQKLVSGSSLIYGHSTSCRCRHSDRRGDPEIVRQLESILCFVANECGFAPDALKGESRKQPLVHIRHFAMWLASRETTASLPAIARVFGGRDHTTALHAVRTMDQRVREEPEWRKLAADLTDKMRQQPWFGDQRNAA